MQSPKRFFFKKKDTVNSVEFQRAKKNKFNFVQTFKLVYRIIKQALEFFGLLSIYFTYKILDKIILVRLLPPKFRVRFQPRLLKLYIGLVSKIDSNRTDSISRLDLIELSIKNMRLKKTRSIITIGGMAIGIGAIVFLVSIGYGLQNLVINRVARLEEMRQADIVIGAGSAVKINDKAIANFSNLSGVQSALPMISVVGRIDFNNSVSDMAVYGVTRDFLMQSAIKPIRGKIFDSNQTVIKVNIGKDVAGVSDTRAIAKVGSEIQPVEFWIEPEVWVRVRANPDINAPIIGYTKRLEGKQTGLEVWGSKYLSEDNSGKAGIDNDGRTLGKWIKSEVLLWKVGDCDQVNPDCEGGRFRILKDVNGHQISEKGYFAELNLTLEGTIIKTGNSSVLGMRSERTLAATDSSETILESEDFVEIASEAGMVEPPETKTVKLTSKAERLAVVNQSMLKILGIAEDQAVGKSFSAKFVVTGNLLENTEENLESVPAEYKIVGVVPEGDAPFFYVPFTDLRSLGISNYSQVKLVTENPKRLSDVRTQVEAMGYMTTSVADTVTQIESLFSTLRTVLALLGMVALAVATLGMFNTLTVSLLERTREVGLMKAMGMKSEEVKELFLTESMIMGFFGGMLGLLLGFIAGKLLGLLLTIFAAFKGAGIIDISYIPPAFVFIILVLSLVVGVVTGIYPARRATKISALNALRYE